MVQQSAQVKPENRIPDSRISRIGWVKLASIQISIEVLLSSLVNRVETTTNLINQASFRKFAEAVPGVIPANVNTVDVSFTRQCSWSQIAIFPKGFQNPVMSWAHPVSRFSGHISILASCIHRYTDYNTETLEWPLLLL